MAINALVISGPDPGAIPGGSTISPRVIGGASMGPTSIDGRVKKIAFARVGPAHRAFKLPANDNFAEEYAVAA